MFFGHQFTHDQNMRFRLTKNHLQIQKSCPLNIIGLRPSNRLPVSYYYFDYITQTCRVMYCYSTLLFHYYSYYSSTHRRCLDQTLWLMIKIWDLGWQKTTYKFKKVVCEEILRRVRRYSFANKDNITQTCRVMYCYSTLLFHYYSYYSSTHRRCLDQTLWNLVGISSYAMWSCAFKGLIF
jgi:hypothetical protein